MARLIIAIVATAALAPVIPAAAVAQTDLLDISDRELAALNAHDADAVLAFYADGATLAGSLGCLTPCVGKDAIRAELESLFADGLQVRLIEAEVTGRSVVRRLEATSVSIRAAGVDRIVAIETLQFSDDNEILSVTAEIDLSDAQTQAFLDALAASTLPATGAGPAGKDGLAFAWWWPAAAGGLLLLVGFAAPRSAG